MKLVALVESNDHVCCRYRIAAYADALAERGWSLEIESLAEGVWGRTRQFLSLDRADAVLLQRRMLPWWQLALLRRSARTLLFDYDDAVFWRDSSSPKPPESRFRLFTFWLTLQAADGVSAGNAFLADQANAYVSPGKVVCLPTCLRPDLYHRAEHHRRGSDVRVVWIGSHSTLPSLELAEAGLTLAARRADGLALHVICDAFPEMPDVKVVHRPWSSATEADDLAAADIGLSWLPDHPWSLGKCALKVLQYQAAGLPVVGNSVGLNRDLIRDGETGLLANTSDELADAVERLSRDPALRRRLGAAGRRQVEESFNRDYWAQRFVEWIEQAVRASRRSKDAPNHLGEPSKTFLGERANEGPRRRPSRTGPGVALNSGVASKSGAAVQ
ncbi:MAG TPA: glycosyltransferase [Pirellulales bacterium]